MTTPAAPTRLSWETASATTLAELAEHSANHAPYCNLDVVDLWAYRVHPVRWCRVGDAVLYRLSDYMTDEPYYTVLGRSSTRDAVADLAHEFGGEVELRCVPAESAEALSGWDAVIDCLEDPDNHDYILDAGELADLPPGPLRRKHRALLRRHPDLAVQQLDRRRSRDRENMYGLFRRWVAQTNAADWRKEFLALRRALHLGGPRLICLGVFDGPNLVAYSVNGPVIDGYYQGFFGKVDRSYPGLGIHLEHVTATHMRDRHAARLLNLQPDSGIPGLRRYKQSLGPCAMLKKYTVRIRTDRN